LEQNIEHNLWILYRKNRDSTIRDNFIKQYAPLVKYVAGKIAITMPPSVEFDDLVGFGVFGLLDAIDKFDPAKGVKFKTYAVTRIRGAILDELRAIDWVPRSVRQKTREVENAVQTVEAKLGRIATDQEIAVFLGVKEEDFYKMMLKISGTSILSLNDKLLACDDHTNRSSIGDKLEAPQTLNPEFLAEREDIRRIIIDNINALPDKEKKVLILYYYEDLTLKEIGQVLNVTESRVSQLHTKAILHIKEKLKNIQEEIR
jgi:RNA polymerase sigma factor for flagellar operon FliA